MFNQAEYMSRLLARIAPVLTLAVLYAASSTAAQADCAGQIHNRMAGSYSFKVFQVDADENYTEMQGGALAPGESASFDFVSAYGTEVIEIYENDVRAFSTTLREDKLSSCNYGNSGGFAPFCLGIPEDQDITILPQRYNCDKNRAQ